MWEKPGMLRLNASLMERSFNNLINLQICMQPPILSVSQIRLPPPPLSQVYVPTHILDKNRPFNFLYCNSEILLIKSKASIEVNK